MFTGIVAHVGTVRSARTTPSGARLEIELGPLAAGLAEGDSVAVNGACLTAVDIRGQAAGFDVVAETLKRTTLGRLAAGARVNLERALRLDGRLDGHLVQGHVDAQAELVRVSGREKGQWVMEFSASPELTRAMVPKGSVALDGVSLTLTQAQDGRFAVSIIPATLERTTLGSLQPGQAVNVETDIIGKYVLRYLGAMSSAGSEGRLTLQKLRDAGFA